MRILSVSDLHYSLPQLDWVLTVSNEYELVVLAGDLLDIASSVSPDAQIAVVVEYLTRLAERATVVACSGNHDLDARNELDERAAAWLVAARGTGAHVDGTRFERDDVVVSVCPWWDGPRTRDVLDAQLRADAELVGDRKWIWVYHGPPDASPTSWTGQRHYGDEALNAWIAQHHPDLVLCGHVHQSPFVEGGAWFDRISTTVVVNAGRQPGPVPSHIEVDTTTGLAVWMSATAIDERTLEVA